MAKKSASSKAKAPGLDPDSAPIGGDEVDAPVPDAPARTGKSGKNGKKAAAEKPRPGLRGAAPWAARHAKKHAAEAAARNAEPPRPGSARATLREPEEAERIKQRVTELHNLLGRLKPLRKNLNQNFYDLGIVLGQIRDRKLYEAKGYTSLESMAERELDLGKNLAQSLARIPVVFIKEAALEHGLEALVAALTAIDEAAGKGPRVGPPAGRAPLPLKPPTR
jgi:hypothetical protein